MRKEHQVVYPGTNFSCSVERTERSTASGLYSEDLAGACCLVMESSAEFLNHPWPRNNQRITMMDWVLSVVKTGVFIGIAVLTDALR